eukprot:GFUD01088051.1.p1 GENE.GFUD01088051.1~~GFUD01088051.1.p1  ORF type:complete len:186 (-),score=52.31 GFUD01088051.1:141-665(-)
MEQIVQSSICMENDSLFLPLQQMKNDNPLFAACMLQMFVNKQQLAEGLNSLDGVGDTFEIGITKKDIAEKILVNMEEFKQKTCPSTGNTATALTVCLFVIVVIVALIGLGLFVKNKQKEHVESEGVDINPDYGGEYYGDEDCEVKDRNDYYFDDQPDGITQITDVNDYYSVTAS